MWLAIFFVSANGKRIIYLTEAISLEISGCSDGVFVEQSFFKSPGRKKLAGETLWLELIPLQPAAAIGRANNMASRRKFQFNLTCRL
jgi:hypothetical protein